MKTYSTSTQFEYDANGNLKYDNRDGLKAMYLYDYRNRLIGVRPERWDQWWSSTTTVPQPGYVCVDNGEFSIYSANNVSSTYVEREIPDVSLHDDVPYPNTELSFDFYRVASIDCNRFYFYFMNSETGAYLRVHYYRRSHTINVGQYSAANGYEDIYTNTAFYEDDGNCKLVIATGDIISFYFDGVLKGTTLLDEEIDDINNVRILINEGHFHYDDIIVDQIFNAGTPSEYTTTIVDLDFSDGPYAQFADYYYNTNDERILTVKSQEAASYYPFKTSIYNGNGQTLCEYKINKSASYSFLNDYVYGNGQKLAKFDGLDVEYFHNNYLGSIQAITNESGTVTWSRDYYPFGEEKGTGTGADDANVYKFTGKEWDDESDFFYYWHRYYDPEIGRFVQVDPMWSKYSSMSPYNYTLNNPLRYIDPTGEWVFLVGITLTGGAGTALTYETGIAISQDKGKFQVGTYQTSGGGFFAGYGGSVTGSFTLAPLAKMLRDVRGVVETLGGSGGEGGTIGGDINIPLDGKMKNFSGTLNLGASGGTPAEAHAFTTTTTTHVYGEGSSISKAWKNAVNTGMLREMMKDIFGHFEEAYAADKR